MQRHLGCSGQTYIHVLFNAQALNIYSGLVGHLWKGTYLFLEKAQKEVQGNEVG